MGNEPKGSFLEIKLTKGKSRRPGCLILAVVTLLILIGLQIYLWY